MKFLGLIFCGIAICILYKRLSLIIFGKSAKGVIIGNAAGYYGSHGISAYPYRVRYEYMDNFYYANALESASGSNGGVFSKKNIQKEVTVYFIENNPELVTIKEFKSLSIISIVFFLLGIITIFF